VKRLRGLTLRKKLISRTSQQSPPHQQTEVRQSFSHFEPDSFKRGMNGSVVDRCQFDRGDPGWPAALAEVGMLHLRMKEVVLRVMEAWA